VLFAVGGHGLLYSREPGRQSALCQFSKRLTVSFHASARELHAVIMGRHGALDFQTSLNRIDTEHITHSPTETARQFNRKIDQLASLSALMYGALHYLHLKLDDAPARLCMPRRGLPDKLNA